MHLIRVETIQRFLFRLCDCDPTALFAHLF